MTSRRPIYRLNRGRIAAASGGGASSVFPLAGHIAWISTFYGDDTTHLTVASSKITQFVNQSTAVAWPNATSAEQFAWEANDLATGLNGFPCGHPDSGDKYRATEAALLAIPNGNSDHTVFFVASPDVAAAFQVFCSWANSASASGYLAYGLDVSGKIAAYSTAAFRLGTTVLTNNRPRVIALKRSGNVLTAWIDGVSDALDAGGAFAVGALTTNRFTLNRRGRSTDDLPWVGRSGELLVYPTALTDGQIVTQSLQMVERWQLTYARFLAAGDSLSRGFGSVSAQRLEERITPTRSTQRYSAAQNGWETANLTASEATLVTPRRRTWSNADVVCCWIGNNDIKNTADSAVVIYGRIQTLIDSYQAAGFEVIAVTVTHRDSAELSGDGLTLFNTVCDALNVLILANAAGAEATVDAQAYLDGLGATSDTAPNAWYSDDTHLTDLTYNGIASLVTTALNGLI